MKIFVIVFLFSFRCASSKLICPKIGKNFTAIEKTELRLMVQLLHQDLEPINHPFFEHFVKKFKLCFEANDSDDAKSISAKENNLMVIWSKSFISYTDGKGLALQYPLANEIRRNCPNSTFLSIYLKCPFYNKFNLHPVYNMETKPIFNGLHICDFTYHVYEPIACNIKNSIWSNGERRKNLAYTNFMIINKTLLLYTMILILSGFFILLLLYCCYREKHIHPQTPKSASNSEKTDFQESCETRDSEKNASTDKLIIEVNFDI